MGGVYHISCIGICIKELEQWCTIRWAAAGLGSDFPCCHHPLPFCKSIMHTSPHVLTLLCWLLVAGYGGSRGFGGGGGAGPAGGPARPASGWEGRCVRGAPHIMILSATHPQVEIWNG
jgi:hypothetical protein